METVEIDGSVGEGGGQILRSSLALAVVTQKRLVMDKIRAGRKKPGLMRQHRVAVQAAAAISGAEVSGDELGSRRLAFQPSRVRAGDYKFSIATAGSASLVLQTVLPPLLLAGGTSTLVLKGGTHNPFAPPFDFLVRSFFPVIERMGVRIVAKLERYGFYPAGGGRFTVRIEPAPSLAPLELLERGEVQQRRGRVVLAHLPSSIGQREIDGLAQGLGWPHDAMVLENVESAGPGNIVLVEVQSANITEVFTGFGEKGVAVPEVLAPLIKEVRTYLGSTAPVGVHLADQLLLPLAIGGGGQFRTVGLSTHATTNIEVIGRFLSRKIETERRDRGDVLVRVG